MPSDLDNDVSFSNVFDLKGEIGFIMIMIIKIFIEL
jgi:hypothetical protein